MRRPWEDDAMHLARADREQAAHRALPFADDNGIAHGRREFPNLAESAWQTLTALNRIMSGAMSAEVKEDRDGPDRA